MFLELKFEWNMSLKVVRYSLPDTIILSAIPQAKLSRNSSS